ncbi:MAG: hypothetical protein MJY67_06320, partial [Bacteroidales bacterium]|nr:hypothetical protein [Bacteroidales bacterium]
PVEMPVEMSVEEPVDLSVEVPEITEVPADDEIEKYVAEVFDIPVETIAAPAAPAAPVVVPETLHEVAPEVQPEVKEEVKEVKKEVKKEEPKSSFSMFDEGSDEGTLNARHRSRSKKAVADMMENKEAWRTDRPGSPVKDVRSAISLNDRVIFIRQLFKEDPMAFQGAVTVINGMDSLEDVVAYLKKIYPDWKYESDTVYRFMMAVRRKIG